MTKEQIDEFIHQIYPHLKDLEHGMVSADYVESKILTALSGVGEEEKTKFAEERILPFVRQYGVYQDSYANIIPTEMLMQYEHNIDDDEGIIWLDRPIIKPNPKNPE